MSVGDFVMEVEVRRFSALLLLLFATGCQCGTVSECWSTKVEKLVCHVPRFDKFYKPEHDITRMGQPDWCCSPKNRMLFGCACEKNCGTCESCDGGCNNNSGPLANGVQDLGSDGNVYHFSSEPTPETL